MPVPRWWKKLKYESDHWLSRGPQVLIIWLAVISAAIILAFALVLNTTGLAPKDEPGFSFIEAAWLSLMRTMGGGSMGDRSTPWAYRGLMFLITLGGIFIISTLIGTLTSSIHERIAELRKGRSEVMEDGQTVILGWTEQIFNVVKELVYANASQTYCCIVIMAQQDKVVMEEKLRDRVGDTGKVRLVCRTGNPMDMEELRIVNLNGARSILVLSPESANPDADAIKTVLAILNRPDRRAEPYHIVSVIRNMKNLDVARVVGKDEVEWIGSGDVISRIIAQTSRQVGLSAVYTELLDFRGNEIYFHADPALENKTFGEILNAYDNETVIGIYSADAMVKLNPSMKRVIKQGDKMILIAPDDSEIAVHSGLDRHVDRRLIVSGERNGHKAEKTLMLGWNWRAQAILHELDHYVPFGSEVQVVADVEDVSADIAKGCYELKNQRVCVRYGDTSDRGLLESLELGTFDHVILLSYSDRLGQQQADAHTLMTLLHVRDIAQKYDYHFSIVTEMLDVRNRRLASVTKVDDFIVSDRLVSLLMAQISQNKELNRVFSDLFNTSGSELYLKPVDQYVRVGRQVNFFTLVEAARKRKEVAVGYRISAYAADYAHGFGISLNPPKLDSITFHPEDRVIVLARE